MSDKTPAELWLYLQRPISHEANRTNYEELRRQQLLDGPVSPPAVAAEHCGYLSNNNRGLKPASNGNVTCEVKSVASKRVSVTLPMARLGK